MGDTTKLGLGIAGAAAMLGLLGDGLLRATPWGLNVFIFALALVALAADLARWRGVDLRGEGRVRASTGLTYAEYARRGFFELVTVTALVLPLLLLAHWILRSEKPLHLWIFRALSTSLVVLLFVVMASALQRMRLYTAGFGLTELRLYTTAFMAWIFVVLLLFLLTVLRSRRPLFAPAALATGFLAVALLNALNPDAFIVRTNLARAERGHNLDAPYLASLSADAVPPLMEALPRLPEKDRRAVETGLEVRRAGPAPGDWRTSNLCCSRATKPSPPASRPDLARGQSIRGGTDEGHALERGGARVRDPRLHRREPLAPVCVRGGPFAGRSGLDREMAHPRERAGHPRRLAPSGRAARGALRPLLLGAGRDRRRRGHA